MGVVESMEYLILHCPIHNKARRKFLASFFHSNASFVDHDLLLNLLASTDPTTIRQLVMFISQVVVSNVKHVPIIWSFLSLRA